MTPRAAPRERGLHRGEQVEHRPLQEGDPAPRVDLMADRGQVEDHQAHEEESALVDVDGQRHR